jgi:flagellar hook assembly protein FlgD
VGVAGVGPSSGRLSFSVSPNPARTAKFAFSLPEASDVEIGIYDVAGRQVATLFKGTLPAGSYSRDWSGRDSDGHNVGAGVFFARMKAGGQMRALRTVYLGR